jgi:GAF domain-containing protein
VVNLIRERFGLYFVGLYQTDENSEWAVLKAGTGQAGQILVAQGYRIPVGSGMIGWSIANSQPRIAVDSGIESTRQKQGMADKVHPADITRPSGLRLELPETNSEAALPLRSRGQVIGALSLQSAVSDAFDKDNITVFQILADQVAIALDNARLFAEGQETLKTMQQIYGEMSREAWDKLLHEQISVAYRADIQGVSEQAEIAHMSGSDQAILEIPIKVRGNVIGILDTHKTTENPNWKPEEVAMVQTVADQLGLALESAQLYREAQYRAERERLISQITTQMRESLDVDTVLQTAAREMLNTLGLQDIAIHLGEIPIQGNISIRQPTG